MVEKMDGKTMNITEENLNKLKDLFPEVFEEGKINFDKLQVVLGENIDKSNEKYEFSWNGKFETMKLAQLQSTGTLIPCKEKSKDWDTTQNLYIEGDNLEVLKLLQKSYVNQIKMIYIDPPYNTGNDFVYKDNFADNIANYKEITGQATKSNAETSGRYHTNWLNMMYPRLKLARNLLKDDGIIFISIDDNEQANLKKICDEIFGENNFIAQFPRITKKGGKSSDVIAKNHDYVLMYRKSLMNGLYPLEHNDDGFKFEDEYVNERGLYKLNQTLDYDSLQYSKSLDYPLEIDGKTYYAGESYEKYLERQKGNHNSADWAWRWSKAKFDFGLKNGFIVVKNSKNGSRIYTKTYQNATIEDKGNGYEVVLKERTKSMSTLDTTLNEFSNDNATKDLDAVLDKKLFDFSKPVSLIKLLLKLTTKDSDIVLDFFSGSGTTAHAVLEQNNEDNCNRKFICVQLPEFTEETSEAYRQGYKNICDIGEERIRRAGQKIVESTPLTANTIDTGFKVFKLDTSNLVKWNNTPTEDVEELKKRLQQNLFYIVDGRSNMDLVYEIMLKYGLPLTLPINEKKYGDYKAYEIASDTYKVMICLDRNLPIEIIEQMTDESVGTYVFADHCFGDANILINTEEILKKKSKNLRIF